MESTWVLRHTAERQQLYIERPTAAIVTLLRLC